MSKDVELKLNGKVILLIGGMDLIYKVTQTLAKDGNEVSVRNHGETEWMPIEVPEPIDDRPRLRGSKSRRLERGRQG